MQPENKEGGKYDGNFEPRRPISTIEISLTDAKL